MRTQTLAEMLRQRVKRQTWRLRLIVASEILLTVIVLGLTAATLPAMRTSSALRVSAVVLLYTAGVWVFVLWNRRGIWNSYGESMADCVALLRTRAQRRVRSAWFSMLVIAAASLLVSGQIVMSWRADRIGSWEQWVWAAFGAYSIILVAWSYWYLRRAHTELRELAAIGRDLKIFE